MPQDIVRVLQITDPHLFAEADNNLRGTVTADTLNAVVDHVLEQRWPADFVVLTGDLVQDAGAPRVGGWPPQGGMTNIPPVTEVNPVNTVNPVNMTEVNPVNMSQVLVVNPVNPNR